MNIFQTESALVHDAVRIFARAIRDLDPLEKIEKSRMNCKHPNIWAQGARIVNYMKIVSFYFVSQKIIKNN